jgi:hypothetical protein
VPDFAERLAAALALPFVPALQKVCDTAEQKDMENSTQQARNLDGSLAGSDGIRQVEVAPGVFMAGTTCGPRAFGPNGEVFQVMNDLMTALESGTTEDVRQLLGDLDAARAIVIDAWVDVGARMASLDELTMMGVELRTSVDLERDGLTAVDVAAVAPAVATAEAMLFAVIESSKTLMNAIGRGWLSRG